MPKPPLSMNEFSSLMQIVKDLRGPDGCPWDKEQTHQSLAPFAIEELFEMIEALESNNDIDFKEELGDVLFQVALHCQLAAERGAFTYQDVIQTLSEKLIRRHPHVFENGPKKDIHEVWTHWEKIKKEEKKNKQRNDSFFDFPKQLPALQRAHKIGVKGQKLHFDWKLPENVFAKVLEELNELNFEIQNKTDQAISQEKIQEEFGDLLFSLAQWARHLGIEPEQSLRLANQKFEFRFEKMMKLAQARNLVWDDLSDFEKERLWQEIKLDI
jgi:tetrapyrrole methylase family protein/MazG family protein